tara:strand:- start:1478 stop:2158 length:681 start_codon:yes stop_codon:yes gene_type:complete
MVDINVVYQKVLAFANKEQRGYITPQEFNLFADQAQVEIFEQYFYDLDQRLRVNSNSDEYADIRDVLQEKITIFEASNTSWGTIGSDVYRLGTIRADVDGVLVEVEEVQPVELTQILQSPLTKPTAKRPIYTRRGSSITINPDLGVTFSYDYVRRPVVPKWGFVVVGGKALYDGSAGKTVNFELHQSEENELVYKILKFAGLSMKRDDLASGGQGLETVQLQQEKQ